MALDIIYATGFDECGTQADAVTQLQALGWTCGKGAGGFYATSSGKTGIALNMIATFCDVRRTVPTTSRLRIAFFHKFASTGTEICAFYDGTTLQAYLVQTNATTITLFRGDGTSQGTFTVASMATATWHHYDIDITIDDSAGACDIYINGTEHPTALTGKDTNNGGGNQLTKFALGNVTGGSSAQLDYDDVVVQTPSGQFPLTPLQLDPLPVSGAGTNAEFTPSAGSNYQCVDEVPFSTSDYVESSSAGAKDHYAMSDCSLSGSVKAVIGLYVAKNTTGGANGLVPSIIISGTVYDLASQSLTTSDDVKVGVFKPSDVGGSLTTALVNGMNLGQKVG